MGSIRTSREEAMEFCHQLALNMGYAARNGDYGDEWTSREIRDAMHFVAEAIDLARKHDLSIEGALERVAGL